MEIQKSIYSIIMLENKVKCRGRRRYQYHYIMMALGIQRFRWHTENVTCFYLTKKKHELWIIEHTWKFLS